MKRESLPLALGALQGNGSAGTWAGVAGDSGAHRRAIAGIVVAAPLEMSSPHHVFSYAASNSSRVTATCLQIALNVGPLR